MAIRLKSFISRMIVYGATPRGCPIERDSRIHKNDNLTQTIGGDPRRVQECMITYQSSIHGKGAYQKEPSGQVGI